MSIKINNQPDEPTIRGPYENERQARADVAGIYAECDRSYRRGVMGEANLAYLRHACERAGVTLAAYDSQILAWLAGWEPETCAVITGLVTRAYASGATNANSAPLLDPYCQTRQQANCPGRLCQCPHCQHRLPQ